MRAQNRTFTLIKLSGTVSLALLLLTTWFVQPAIGVNPPMQGPPERPTLPLPGTTPVGPGVEGKGGVAANNNCAAVRGVVINWGYQNEPGVTVHLGDGGWEATQITSTDGRYGFGPLGEGVAFLSMRLTDGQAKTLRPMVNDVAIRLRCDFDIIANLGLYSSRNRPDPPATLTMGVSQATLLPGGTATFYLTLKNGMPHAISHVFVTDYLPAGLTVVDVATTRGVVEVLDGRMVTVNMGDLPQGGKETVQIAVRADRALAYGTRLQNTASLLYAESAADQSWATLVVGSAAAPPTAGTPMAQAATPSPTATTTQPAAETPTPIASQTPKPGELLPITGEGPTVSLPAIGIGLAIVVLAAHRLRRRLAE